VVGVVVVGVVVVVVVVLSVLEVVELVEEEVEEEEEVAEEEEEVADLIPWHLLLVVLLLVLLVVVLLNCRGVRATSASWETVISRKTGVHWHWRLSAGGGGEWVSQWNRVCMGMHSHTQCDSVVTRCSHTS
jgi:hypothetical protein